MNTLFQTPTPYRLPKLKLLPLREQPAYRVTNNAAACSLAELLAAVIGGTQQIEVAEALLARFGDIHGLHRAHVAEIAQVKGIGQPTAIRIKAALALGQHILDPLPERPLVQSPADAAALVQHEMSLLAQEYLWVILLDTRNRVIGIEEIYHGSLNSSQVRIGELFKPAITRMAAAVLVCHNHPSGDPTPSPDDVAVTRAIVQAGKLMDVSVLDHLVIGGGGRWVSLKERGLGFDAGRVSEGTAVYRVAEDADVVYCYTRAQALDDGVLVDVSGLAWEAGFRYPTAITADLHARLEPDEQEQSCGQSYDGRLWDVLWMARCTMLGERHKGGSQAAFDVIVADYDPHSQGLVQTILDLWVVVGPGDSFEPVITIGFPADF